MRGLWNGRGVSRFFGGVDFEREWGILGRLVCKYIFFRFFFCVNNLCLYSSRFLVFVWVFLWEENL